MARVVDVDRMIAMFRANGRPDLADQLSNQATVVETLCQQIVGQNGGNAIAVVNPGSTNFPGGNGGGGGGDCAGGACPTGIPGGYGNCGRNNPYYPSMNFPGCPANCDDCAFPNIPGACELYSFPEIEPQLWDTDTKINNLITGVMPLAAGQTVVFGQEARRTLGWIPECVQISTTWSGGQPQPGLLDYQWASGPKTGGGGGLINFSNVQNGQQYECGTSPGSTATCIKVPFPTYKGCDSIPIGPLSQLALKITLSAAATSVLEGILITVYHKKNPKKKHGCCGKCGGNGNCGGCG